MDRQAKPGQSALLEIVRQPPGAFAELRQWSGPRHHDVRTENVDLKRLGAVLAVAYEREFRDSLPCCCWRTWGPIRSSRWR